MAKCLTGCLLGFAIAGVFTTADPTWFTLSTLLVLSPAGDEALPFTLDRIKANIAGGVSSIIVLLIGFQAEIGILIAIVFAIILCAFAGVMGVSRPALATVLIVMLHPTGAHVWDTALERLFAVIGGCVAGLAITYVFHLGNIKWKIQNDDV